MKHDGTTLPGRLIFPIQLLALLVLLCIVILFSAGVGAAEISPRIILRILLDAVFDQASDPSGEISRANRLIVLNLRLPRTILAALVGAGLALSGTAFQGLFRNPLADPFVIGASSGAALGATVAILFNIRLAFLGMTWLPTAAFIGAIGAVAIVYIIARTGGGDPPAVSLLLAGTALSSLFSAMVSFLMALQSEDLHKIFFWLLGSFNSAGWDEVAITTPYIVLSMAGLLVLARPLDLLSFGEESARSMGLSVETTRLGVVLAASLAAAAAVATCGIIGFVGLIAPHMARLIFGPLHRRLMPAAMLIGAVLLVAADMLARTVLAPMELPVGILTSTLGAPFFLYLLRRRQQELGD